MVMTMDGYVEGRGRLVLLLPFDTEAQEDRMVPSLCQQTCLPHYLTFSYFLSFFTGRRREVHGWQVCFAFRGLRSGSESETNYLEFIRESGPCQGLWSVGETGSEG